MCFHQRDLFPEAEAEMYMYSPLSINYDHPPPPRGGGGALPNLNDSTYVPLRRVTAKQSSLDKGLIFL